MLRCFALIALPTFSLFALAAESAAAPIDSPPGPACRDYSALHSRLPSPNSASIPSVVSRSRSGQNASNFPS